MMILVALLYFDRDVATFSVPISSGVFTILGAMCYFPSYDQPMPTGRYSILTYIILDNKIFNAKSADLQFIVFSTVPFVINAEFLFHDKSQPVSYPFIALEPPKQYPVSRRDDKPIPTLTDTPATHSLEPPPLVPIAVFSISAIKRFFR